MQIELEPYAAQLKISEREGVKYLFDPVRKKDIQLQPEELVRQLWMIYLHSEHGYAYSSMAVEKELQLGPQGKRRYDLVYHKKGIPHILFEFKRFSTALNLDTCLQIAQYNKALQIPYLIMSNGHTHYGHRVNHLTNEVSALTEWPVL